MNMLEHDEQGREKKTVESRLVQTSLSESPRPDEFSVSPRLDEFSIERPVDYASASSFFFAT